MSIIEISGLNQGYDDRNLFEDAAMKVNRGEHAGLVGVNGAGKTTLMRIILGEIVPDSGCVSINKKTKIGYLDQSVSIEAAVSIDEYLRQAFAELYAMDRQIQNIYDDVVHEPLDVQMKCVEKAESMRAVLETRGFGLIDKRIRNVSAGLGIDGYGMDAPLKSLSGGQRARVILARLLLEDNDIMLLDEPTNFLDVAFVGWLAEYLNGYEGAFVVISHDAEFLSKVSRIILSVENKKIVRYEGSYSSFTALRAKREEEYSRQYVSQQKLIKSTEDFIRKNITRAATSGRAKSRIKMLDRIDRLDKPASKKDPTFKLSWAGSMHRVMITAENLSIGYRYALLPAMSLKIARGEKCVIKGFNGIGKTTLLKTMAGELQPFGGRVSLADNAVTEFFHQEEAAEDITPIEYIGRYYGSMSRKDIMGRLSLCGVGRELMTRPISSLSGGERTKVRLCRLTMAPADILLLDEPTNHLDEGSKRGLIKGLVEFEGCVVLTSHDMNFDVSWADRVINLEEMTAV